MYIHDNNKIVHLDDYIKDIKNSGIYSGELEIYCIAKVFNISIYVYEINNNNLFYRYLYKYENTANYFSHCCIINHKILQNNIPHYELLTINEFTFDVNELNKENTITKIRKIKII